MFIIQYETSGHSQFVDSNIFDTFSEAKEYLTKENGYYETGGVFKKDATNWDGSRKAYVLSVKKYGVKQSFKDKTLNNVIYMYDYLINDCKHWAVAESKGVLDGRRTQLLNVLEHFDKAPIESSLQTQLSIISVTYEIMIRNIVYPSAEDFKVVISCITDILESELVVAE